MDFFVIDLKRLKHHIEYDVRKNPRGTMNWYVGEENTLHVFLSIQGVNYLYRQSFSDPEEIDVDVRSLMHSQRSVLGFASFEEEKPVVQEPITVSLRDLFSTGVTE